MVKTITIFKNYLLNKSNQYRYYKSHYVQLKEDIIRLEDDLRDLNIKLDEKIHTNSRLKEDVIKLNKEIATLTYEHPPGHFYSPINDSDFLRSREDRIWKPEFIEGIEIHEKEQLDLFKSFTKYYAELPFKSTKQPNLRYYFENNMYGVGSGILLYFMIRTLKPNKIIEIGSGFSSALMMDVNNIFFENKIELTFIEPYPERLYSLMSEQDKVNNEIIPKLVQDVGLEKFKELGSNDILFIDSSHVVKAGSDVQHILFKILPTLNIGVYIHFHDIFYPFQYPKSWLIDCKWNWNEEYFVRAFLMYNSQFQIALSSRYLHEYHNELLDYMVQDIPEIKDGFGNSLWLKKIYKNSENSDDIDDFKHDYEIKKKYFFKGKENLLKDLHINTNSFYKMCNYNGIEFLTVLPDQNRLYLKTKDGLILTTNQNLFVFEEIFTKNSYISPKLYEYEEFVLFDVGMHRGYASLAIGQMDSCKAVYGFEIDLDTFEFAKENFALNPQIAKKIHPNQFGLSNSDEDVDIYVIPMSDGRTTTEDNVAHLNQSERDKYTLTKKSQIKKASTVLNQIIETNNITSKIVLKIDTEGAEYKILEDLYNSGVLNKIDLLMGECHFGIEKLEGYLNDFNPIFLDYQYGSKDICTFYFERVE